MKNSMQLRTLTERFFQGETTLAEEHQLYQLYQKAGLPQDLLPYRQMFLDMAALAPAQAEVKPLRRRAAVRWMVAASLLAVVMTGGLWLIDRQSQDECVAYIYGHKTTAHQVVMSEIRQAAHGIVDDEMQVDVAAQLDEMFQ